MGMKAARPPSRKTLPPPKPPASSSAAVAAGDENQAKLDAWFKPSQDAATASTAATPAAAPTIDLVGSDDFVVPDDEEEDDEDEGDDDNGGDDDDGRAAAATRKRPRGKPARASSGRTIEQERRALGDAVKSRISFEKWAIAARTHAHVALLLDVFRELVVPNAARVLPAVFDRSTPVVVARISGSAACGEVFGSSKIKGGSRLGSFAMNECEIVFQPALQRADIWWTMNG